MRTQTSPETSMTTAAIAVGLNLPHLPVRGVPTKKAGRAFVSDGKIAAAIDEFEETLKAGAKVPANPDHPERPYWKAIAAQFGVSSASLCAKHLGHRKRIAELAVAYGLQPAPAEPNSFPFAEFSIVARSHRERELDGETDVARAHKLASFVTAMDAVAARRDLDEEARDALSSAVTEVGVEGADVPFGFLDEVKRAIAYLNAWDTNEDLPRNPAHLLRYALARSGLSQQKACAGSGLTQGSVSNWARGKRGPDETRYARVNMLEKALGLPRDCLTSRFSAWRRQTRPSPVYGATDYGKAAAWRIHHQYCLHDWPTALEAEFVDWTKFRNDRLCPYGIMRPKGRLSAKTIQMQRDYLESVFGSWTTELNPKLRMDPADITLALLVFPRMLHERLQFALARDAAARAAAVAAGAAPETDRDDDGCEGSLTKFEVDQIRWVKSLLDPETGWLTQKPQLADHLVPVTARDGEVLVSEADIAGVRADWKAACARARKEYADMKASNLKHVKRSRDPHASVRPILLLANPLSALATLCRGLERDMVGLDPEPLAYAARDAFIVGMLAQTGFRKGTVEAMEIDDIFFDEGKGKWCLRVPARRFKNGKAGPFFGTGYGRRDHYERDLMDEHGLYKAIDHYLKLGRGLILGDGQTRALFVVHPTERTGVRKQQYSWCEKGRMTTQYLGRLVHGITGKYLRYDPETGIGIPGITSFPGHDIRHIIATGTLKQAVADKAPDPWHLAADAIHDGVRTVKAYVQYLPRDRQDTLLALLRRGLIDG